MRLSSGHNPIHYFLLVHFFSSSSLLSSLASSTQVINDNYKDSVPKFQPPTAHNLNDNFMLYAGQTSSDDEGGMYANLDAAYLMSVAYQEAVPEYTGMCNCVLGGGGVAGACGGFRRADICPRGSRCC